MCFDVESEAEKAFPLAATAKVTDLRPVLGMDNIEPSVAIRWEWLAGWA